MSGETPKSNMLWFLLDDEWDYPFFKKPARNDTGRMCLSNKFLPADRDKEQMVDVLTKEQRSYNMSQIRCKDTKPEKLVRSIVHRLGYRYALHRKDLPGHPDIVLTRHRKVIFVHGCFWHMHKCRYGRVKPKTNAEFWDTKRCANAERDRRNLRKLRKEGWKVLIVWECQTRNPEKLIEKLLTFLER